DGHLVHSSAAAADQHERQRNHVARELKDGFKSWADDLPAGLFCRFILRNEVGGSLGARRIPRRDGHSILLARVAVSRDIVAACSASHQKIGALFRRKSRAVNAVVVETSLLIDIRIGGASIGGRIDVLTRCDVRMFFAAGTLFQGGNVRAPVGSPVKSPGQAAKSASGNK